MQKMLCCYVGGDNLEALEAEVSAIMGFFPRERPLRWSRHSKLGFVKRDIKFLSRESEFIPQ